MRTRQCAEGAKTTYILDMGTLRARPTSLPEGTELELSIVDPGDDLDDAQREALHAAIDQGIADVKAGRTSPAEQVIDELRSKR